MVKPKRVAASVRGRRAGDCVPRVDAAPPMMQVVVEPKKPGKERPIRHALFFTANNELDMGWAILLACCLVGLLAFFVTTTTVIMALIKAKTGSTPLPMWVAALGVAAWAWFGAFCTMAFISGSRRDSARLIAESPAPAAVAAAIAGAQGQMNGATKVEQSTTIGGGTD